MLFIHFTAVELSLPYVSSSHGAYQSFLQTWNQEVTCSHCFFMLLFFHLFHVSSCWWPHNIRSGFLAASRNSSFRPQIPYQRNGCRKPQSMSVSPRLRVLELGREIAHSGTCRAKPLDLSTCYFAVWQVQAETGMKEEWRTLLYSKGLGGTTGPSFFLPWPFASQLLWNARAGRSGTVLVGGVQCIYMS